MLPATWTLRQMSTTLKHCFNATTMAVVSSAVIHNMVLGVVRTNTTMSIHPSSMNHLGCVAARFTASRLNNGVERISVQSPLARTSSRCAVSESLCDIRRLSLSTRTRHSGLPSVSCRSAFQAKLSKGGNGSGGPSWRLTTARASAFIAWRSTGNAPSATSACRSASVCAPLDSVSFSSAFMARCRVGSSGSAGLASHAPSTMRMLKSIL